MYGAINTAWNMNEYKPINTKNSWISKQLLSLIGYKGGSGYMPLGEKYSPLVNGQVKFGNCCSDH